MFAMTLSTVVAALKIALLSDKLRILSPAGTADPPAGGLTRPPTLQAPARGPDAAAPTECPRRASLEAERLDRIETRRFSRRVEPEDDPPPYRPPSCSTPASRRRRGRDYDR